MKTSKVKMFLLLHIADSIFLVCDPEMMNYFPRIIVYYFLQVIVRTGVEILFNYGFFVLYSDYFFNIMPEQHIWNVFFIISLDW